MLHVMHPSEAETRWSRIAEAHRIKLPAVPPVDAPARERIGRPGGSYSLTEVIEEVLAPLARFDRRDVQSRLSIYTVVSFSSDVVLTRRVA